jgi:hypothetical protein
MVLDTTPEASAQLDTSGQLGNAQLDMNTILAAIWTTVSTAMALYTAKINALEKAFMPPPATRTTSVVCAPAGHNRVDDPPFEAAALRVRAPLPTAPIPDMGEGKFTLVTRKGGRKGKGM